MFNPSPWRYNQPPPQPQPQNTIVIDSESDEDDDDDIQHMPIEFTAGGNGQQPQHIGFTGLGRRPPLHPHAPSYSHSRSHSHLSHVPGPSSLTYPPPLSHEQEMKLRSRLREERHAALCVLMDRELLTIQALAAQETLPQTRRRFLTKLLSPDDPDTAAALRADQVLIPMSSTPFARASSSSAHTTSGSSIDGVVAVSRGIVDVCETDDSGWYRDNDGGGGGSGSAVSSPGALGKVRGKGAGTPERTRGKGRISSGRHSGHQGQTRERRRRWSGAERQDYGVTMMPP
ncbi:hypothetical protein BJX66DRAFT_339742 [Aspergillus keveii]|uniref:Uncharacterized protein n=1 Tax=Aspergillus keveii TaxID=714993 RepID=A0ABR4G0A4_9EURO